MADSIFDRIAAGDHDAQLEPMFRALNARRKYLAGQKAAANKSEMVAGTRVKITEGIRPHYLVGITGTVSTRPARRAGDVQVDVDPACVGQMGKYGRGGSVGVPANCLARI
jgi:hypothetical protein